MAQAETVTRELVDAGADLIAPPTVTPWDTLNSRLQAPGDLHITVFQELASSQSPEAAADSSRG